MHVTRNPKLFRAIVVMGAALTAPGCDFFEEDCCSPKRDAAIVLIDAPTVRDGGVDAPPGDAPVDTVIIL